MFNSQIRRSLWLGFWQLGSRFRWAVGCSKTSLLDEAASAAQGPGKPAAAKPAVCGY